MYVVIREEWGNIPLDQRGECGDGICNGRGEEGESCWIRSGMGRRFGGASRDFYAGRMSFGMLNIWIFKSF